MQKVVSTSDAQQYARQMNLTFFETSAKDNKNVDEAFYAVTRLALKHRLESRTKGQNNDLTNGAGATIQPIRLKTSGKSKKKDKKHDGGCCK
jgi:Ras-related protein Rab-35